MKKAAFPKIIQVGHSKAIIYKTPNRGTFAFTVAWYEGEIRKRKVFADLEAAELHARARVGQLSRGEAQILKLDGPDLLAYVRAKAMLEEFGLALDTVAAEYRDAKRLMRGGSLIDAASYFARQHLLDIPKKPLAEVYTEMIEAKKAEGCSDRYIHDLESRVGKFVQAFSTRLVSGVMGSEIKDWLQGLERRTSRTDPNAPKRPVSNRTRNNSRLCVQTLFSFARSQRYLGADWNEMDMVPLWKVKDEEIEIFTPSEMTVLLALAPANIMPFLSIGAFAGLRSAEIERLDWSKVDLEGGYITVDASISKTNSRRLVPIAANLKDWLVDHRKPQGKVVGLANVARELRRLVSATRVLADGHQADGHQGDGHQTHGDRLPPPAVKWKHNALRHSFCSYRLADVKSAAQVSLEAGNSPQMVFRHYRELVTEKAAKAWFAITPEIAKAVRAEIESQRLAKMVAHPALVAA